MPKNDWKERLGMVYSTNPHFAYEPTEAVRADTLPAAQQRLRVSMERAGRGGKTVTLVRGFVGTDDDLKALARQLKTKCGTGGSAKDGEIVIQGDVRMKLVELLLSAGYTGTK